MIKEINVPQAVASIKAQLPALKYPIANATDLLKQISGRTVTGPLKGKSIRVEDGIKHFASKHFPVASDADFTAKISSLLQSHARKKGVSVKLS